MILQSKPLSALTEADLRTLVDNEVPEGKLLDYKRDLPGTTDTDKKEFLFDVSSFANASGGYLVYGIDEEGGIAKQIVGLTVTDTDAEIRRLQNMVLDAIEPRIPGFDLGYIPVSGGKGVLIISIPKSWALPHMVTFKGTNKFYSRNTGGKYPVDVGELRALFVASETISERVKKFRTERVSQILADETPIRLDGGAKTILHVVPLQAFSATANVDLKIARTLPAGLLYPLGASGYNTRINLDGLLNHVGFGRPDTGVSAYLQLYRNGIIETVDASTLNAGAPNPHSPSSKIVPSTLFERSLLERIPDYLQALERLGLHPPFVAMLTLIGVKGFMMATRERFISGTPSFDRDVLAISEIILEKTDCSPSDIKPILDSVWNAGGIICSPNFDAQNMWSPR